MNIVNILFNACESGDLETATRLLESADCDVTSIRMVDSRSFLDVSIDAKHVDIIKALLPLEFNMDGTLVRAATTDDPETVKMIIAAIPEIDNEVFCNALLNACKSGCASSARQLLSYAADQAIVVDLADLLTQAFAAGHADVVAALIDAGADVSEDFSVNDGLDIFYDSCSNVNPGHAACIDLVANAGADVSLDDVSVLGASSAVVQRLLAGYEWDNSELSSAFGTAACEGHVDIVKALLLAMDFDYSSNIECALTGNPHVGVVQVLFDSFTGALQPEQHLHIALRAGCVETVKKMLAAGPDSSLVSSELHFVSEPAMVRLLLDAKADVSDLDGWSVLRMSCKDHQPESVQMLLDAGAPIDGRARELLLRALTHPMKEGKEDDLLSLLQILLKLDMNDADTRETFERLSISYMIGAGIPVSALQMLLDRWPALLSYHEPVCGYSLLGSAVKEGLMPRVKFLVEAGAVRVSTDIIKDLVEAACHLTYQNPIQEQGLRNMQEMLRIFMSAGADVSNIAELLADEPVNEYNEKVFNCVAACFLRDVEEFTLSHSA